MDMTRPGKFTNGMRNRVYHTSGEFSLVRVSCTSSAYLLCRFIASTLVTLLSAIVFSLLLFRCVLFAETYLSCCPHTHLTPYSDSASFANCDNIYLASVAADAVNLHYSIYFIAVYSTDNCYCTFDLLHSFLSPAMDVVSNLYPDRVGTLPCHSVHNECPRGVINCITVTLALGIILESFLTWSVS